MFDIPEVEGGESNDNTEDSDAFQQEVIVDVVSINVEDNIIDYCMGDVETEVVLEGGTSRDANQNEEHDIPDVDLEKLCNPSNIRECLISRKLRVENPMIIQKIVTHSNKK